MAVCRPLRGQQSVPARWRVEEIHNVDLSVIFWLCQSRDHSVVCLPPSLGQPCMFWPSLLGWHMRVLCITVMSTDCKEIDLANLHGSLNLKKNVSWQNILFHRRHRGIHMLCARHGAWMVEVWECGVQNRSKKIAMWSRHSSWQLTHQMPPLRRDGGRAGKAVHHMQLVTRP